MSSQIVYEVTSKTGLRIRSEPSLEGKVLGALPYKARVRVQLR